MPDDHFSITIDRRDPARPVVHLVGEFDLAARDDLTTVLIDLFELIKTESVIVDLDQVPFIDSEATGGILDAYRAAIDADVTLRLRHATGVVHRVFDLMGLPPLLYETAPGTAPGTDVGTGKGSAADMVGS